MFGVLKLGKLGASMKRFNPRTLFAASEPGAWYDPSDMSTLWQDSAGTVPVTAVEQPVGRILDKSGRGNHATQATTTKRPVLSRLVNLHGLNTSTFSGAGLLRSGNGLTPVITANYAAAPDGTNTAVRLQLNSVDTSGTAYSIVSGDILGGGQKNAAYRTSIWMRATTGTATVGLVGAGSNQTFQSLTTAWEQVSLLETGFAGSMWSLRISSIAAHPSAGPQDILVWQPSLTFETDAHLPYQWVNTPTDYDADPAKFPAYLRFDGVDDGLQTGNIDFTGTDKMTVWAGVTKLSDAAFAAIVSTGIISAAPGFYLGNSVGGQNFVSRGRGSVLGATTTASGYAAPNTSILTGIFDISGSKSNLRVNGALTTNSSSLGTGNFSNSPMYIGAGDGTSSYFNGRLYSLIVRGAQSSLSQIEATELYIKQKMRLP